MWIRLLKGVLHLHPIVHRYEVIQRDDSRDGLCKLVKFAKAGGHAIIGLRGYSAIAQTAYAYSRSAIPTKSQDELRASTIIAREGALERGQHHCVVVAFDAFVNGIVKLLLL